MINSLPGACTEMLKSDNSGLGFINYSVNIHNSMINKKRKGMEFITLKLSGPCNYKLIPNDQQLKFYSPSKIALRFALFGDGE